MSKRFRIVEDFARVFRFSAEFLRGFRFFRDRGTMISMFGSARLPESHPYCQLAEELAYRLGKAGFTVLTGGGPSIMRAGNQGARRAGAVSLGCNIRLPFEQIPNAFVDELLEMRYFFSRKYMLVHYSEGFVFLPGGFGTLDELFELLTLMQTRKIPRRPIYLVGTEFWSDLKRWMKGRLLEDRVIDDAALEIFEITDDLEAVIRGLTQKTPPPEVANQKA